MPPRALHDGVWLFADKVFASEDRHPYVAGGFVWSGWIILENRHPTICPEVLIAASSILRVSKDRFYFINRVGDPDLPMAHILPHWTWSERVGMVTPVHVFTSGDEAELFLNGKSLGRKKKGKYEYRLRWDDVIYTPGELRVVAYKNGRKWAEDSVKTVGDAYRLEYEADRSEIKADGNDLSFVTVRITDKKATCAGANNLVRFAVKVR